MFKLKVLIVVSDQNVKRKHVVKQNNNICAFVSYALHKADTKHRYSFYL